MPSCDGSNCSACSACACAWDDGGLRRENSKLRFERDSVYDRLRKLEERIEKETSERVSDKIRAVKDVIKSESMGSAVQEIQDKHKSEITEEDFTVIKDSVNEIVEKLFKDI